MAHAPRSTSLLAPWSQVCEARPQALDQAVRDRLCALIKAVAAQGLSHDRGCSGWPALVVDGGSHVEPWKAAPQPALPVVAVAMVWKWDDTPVRWRRGQGQISGSPVPTRPQPQPPWHPALLPSHLRSSRSFRSPRSGKARGGGGWLAAGRQREHRATGQPGAQAAASAPLPVRRTTSSTGVTAAGSLSLVQRGWLILALANGKSVRVPVPCPNVPLPSGRAEDLWRNIFSVLWTRATLCRNLAMKLPVLLIFVSDAATPNKSMVNHEIDGAANHTFVVHVLCLAHQAHICARSNHLAFEAQFATHLSSASRVFLVGSRSQLAASDSAGRVLGHAGTEW